jgi:CPA1 family monovalent cation:H+ antiporter
VEKFWGQFAFMANSVVFILVGLLFASVPLSALGLWLPALIAVATVALARALAIYGTLIPWNLLRPAARIPASWQHLLAWGSLRGALAVMLVLLVPADLSVPGWTLGVSVRDFLLVITVACIFVTLFVKAPLVGPIMRKLNVGALTKLEETEYHEARVITHAITHGKMREYAEKGYVPQALAAKLLAEHERNFALSYGKSHAEGSGTHAGLAEKSLRLYLIGREKEVLKGLLSFDEVTEPVFKRIYGKLTIQGEKVEDGLPVSPSECFDHRDVFENLARVIRSFGRPQTPEEAAEEQYLYYRAQEILARKALKDLAFFATKFEKPIFGARALSRVKAEYETYRKEAAEKRDAIRTGNAAGIERIDEALALRSAFRVEEKALEQLFRRELLTPKLHVRLTEEYEHEVQASRLKRKKSS